MYKHIVRINGKTLYINSIKAKGDWLIFTRSDGIRYMVHYLYAKYAVCMWLAELFAGREGFDFDAIRGVDIRPSFVKRREELSANKRDG